MFCACSSTKLPAHSFLGVRCTPIFIGPSLSKFVHFSPTPEPYWLHIKTSNVDAGPWAGGQKEIARLGCMGIGLAFPFEGMSTDIWHGSDLTKHVYGKQSHPSEDDWLSVDVGIPLAYRMCELSLITPDNLQGAHSAHKLAATLCLSVGLWSKVSSSTSVP